MPLILLYGEKSWRTYRYFCSFVVNPLQLADYLIFNATTNPVQKRYKIISLLVFDYKYFFVVILYHFVVIISY
jgi:hypothetical protein